MSKKGRITSIRFSDEEHARIAARATAARMTFGDYVRRCGLGEWVADGKTGKGATVWTAPLLAPETPKAEPVTHAESLDVLGDDPFRAGQKSSRR